MKKKNKNNKKKKGFSKSIMNGVDFHHHTTKINPLDDFFTEIKTKFEKNGQKTEIKQYNKNNYVVNIDDNPIVFINLNEGSTVFLPVELEQTYMAIYDYSNVREACAGNLVFFSTKSGEVDNFLKKVPLMLDCKDIYAFNTFKDFIHNLEEPTYEVAPNKWVVTNNVGKPLYYFNGDNCIITKTQNPHVFAILPEKGNRLSGINSFYHCDFFTNEGKTPVDIMKSYVSQVLYMYDKFSETPMLHDDN